METKSPLPESFPPGTEFVDFEGVPVTRAPEPASRCTAWDIVGGRTFPSSSFGRGEIVDESTFRGLVASLHAAS